MTSQKAQIRESNFETLRIIAMFLVLIVHADYGALGAPTQADITHNPVDSIGRIVFEALSFSCVNIFILISGYFGIKPNIKSFLNFIFQCLFFYVGIYLICTFSGIITFNIKDFIRSIAMIKTSWFIYSYIGLYILAPVINSYIKTSTEKQFRNTIIFFYIFQTIYGFIFFSSASFFKDGYSAISFIGLYMLARYVKLYPNKYTTLGIEKDCFVILSSIILLATIEFVFIYFKIPQPNYSYINPLVIISALYTLLAFSKFKFNNKFINWTAASCFAVFLTHCNNIIYYGYYLPGMKYIYDQTNGLTYLLTTFCILLLIFTISVLIDKIRILIWNKVWKVIEKSSIYKTISKTN